jgi:hypothetical protein
MEQSKEIIMGMYYTTIFTKSGKKIIVAGRKDDAEKRHLVGKQLVNYYDKNFTKLEQKQTGDIFYDIYDHFHNSIRNKEKNSKVKYPIAAYSGTFSDDISKHCSPRQKRMVDLWIDPKLRNNEHIVTHELIHARQHMNHNKPHKDVEQKTEFEAVGRMSRHGVVNVRNGYYFAPNKNDKQIRNNDNLTKKQKITAIRELGIYHDRKLLTGSLSEKLIGKPLERRVSKQFKNSYFKRKF